MDLKGDNNKIFSYYFIGVSFYLGFGTTYWKSICGHQSEWKVLAKLTLVAQLVKVLAQLQKEYARLQQEHEILKKL